MKSSSIDVGCLAFALDGTGEVNESRSEDGCDVDEVSMFCPEGKKASSAEGGAPCCAAISVSSRRFCFAT